MDVLKLRLVSCLVLMYSFAGGQPQGTMLAGRVRTHYIAVDEVDWDYARAQARPSQWEPGIRFPDIIGPSSGWFLDYFQIQFGQTPDYIAAGSFATGLVLTECIRRASSLDDEKLRNTASELDCNTFYGRSVGPKFAYKRVMTLVSSDDDLDWIASSFSTALTVVPADRRLSRYVDLAEVRTQSQRTPPRDFNCTSP